MPITWCNCRLCCQMNFSKANCMTSLIHSLIHCQAFKVMEVYWFVCCCSKPTTLSSTLCLPPSAPISGPSPSSAAAHLLPSLHPPFIPSLCLPCRGWMCSPTSTLCRPPMAVRGKASAAPQTCWRVSTCRTAWQSKFQSEESRQLLTFSLQPAR